MDKDNGRLPASTREDVRPVSGGGAQPNRWTQPLAAGVRPRGHCQEVEPFTHTDSHASVHGRATQSSQKVETAHVCVRQQAETPASAQPCPGTSRSRTREGAVWTDLEDTQCDLAGVTS